jgi:polyisoprenoid-binding protein YceI
MLQLPTFIAGAAAVTSLLVATGVGAADFSAVPAGNYQVDAAHGYINFSYTHLGFSNPVLRFNDFDVDLNLDTADVPASELSVVIDVASIDTGVERFDEHLKSDDFFDVANHPTITFRSTAITERADGGLEIAGELTIRDITRPVLLRGRVNKAGINPINETPTVGVSARTTVKRSDWGLDKYVPAVTDAVEIVIEVEMQKR